MSQEPIELTPVVFFKGDEPAGDKDFAIRQLPADIIEAEGDGDPKDVSVTESAPSSDAPPLEPEAAPATVAKAPEQKTIEDSKPTSSTTPTTSPGKVVPSVMVPTPSFGSPSAEK